MREQTERALIGIELLLLLNCHSWIEQEDEGILVVIHAVSVAGGFGFETGAF